MSDTKSIPFHTWDEKKILSFFSSSMEKGLTDAQVEEQRKKHGLNELPQEEGKSLYERVVEQFEDFLVRILLVAATVSFLIAITGGEEEGLSAYVEPFVILLILIINAIVGVWQEYNAENALEALKQLQPDNAHVLRNGEWIEIPATELVPGDIVQVSVGDKVPADIRLTRLTTTTLRAEQASLTGENYDVLKLTQVFEKEDAILQEKKNTLFSSTTIVNGAGKGVVVTTGSHTEIGKIAVDVGEAEDEDTPLKKKLDEFGELLSKVILAICIFVWAINYKNFWDPAHGSVFRGCIYYFKIAVSLAVAAIPEGLPAVITTCLALGTRKMAKKNAIVRKLPSVETLGCTTVICSDKTGTLTTNQMSVISFSFIAGEGQFVSGTVDGHSYEPVGKVTGVDAAALKKNVNLQIFNAVGTVCNDSKIVMKEGRFDRHGSPTEAAIKVLVEKIGKLDSSIPQGGSPQPFADSLTARFPRLATLEFSRDRKCMSVIVKDTKKNKNEMFIKGSPERIIDLCSEVLTESGNKVAFTKAMKDEAQKIVTENSSKGLRCLALAYRDELGEFNSYDGPNHKSHEKLLNPENFAKVEGSPVFVGLVGMQDPPRPEVSGAIDLCRQAGIRVIMITGDAILTANSIARQIGMFDASEDITGKSFTGADFEKLSEAKKKSVLSQEGSLVFARTEPRHKKELVKLLQSQGHIAAMTGDGVNDAPALANSDIGIAMGIAGTEVAKQAAAMVLADDNFSTIVHAVEEGRSIYNNTKAFIRYLISSNIGEVASIFITAALGIPEGLNSVQLLWVNLVTDGPPATALGFNPADIDIMKKPPRRQDDNLISGWVFFRYMVIGLYVGFATVGIFIYWYTTYDLSGDGHSLVTFEQLSNWSECPAWKDFTVANFGGFDFSKNPCTYFTHGKTKASTLSLSVLVTIEMLNALNALSEDGSLVHMPPWVNPWLILAIISSIGLHMVILYIPIMNEIFAITPLDYNEWMLVFYFSAPVILLDEILKFFGRMYSERELKKRLKKD